MRIAYKNSHSRLFLLDYDGTLVDFHIQPEEATPSQRVLAILRRLSAAPGNTIVIVSGRDQNFLEKQFLGLPLTLIAEHGLFVKPPDQPWQAVAQPDSSWKTPIKEVMARSAQAVEGSFVEEKTGSLVWHYRPAADQETAANEARQLLARLEKILPPDGLKLLNGHKNIEVKLSLTNKGEAVRAWLNKPHDFVLAAGDDVTDEDLFAALPGSAWSIKIGPGESKATLHLPAPNTLVDLLESLA